MVQISEILPESKIPTSEGCKAIIRTNVFNSILHYGKTVAHGVQDKNSTWEGRGHLKYRPVPYSSDISLRTQKQYSLKPNEIIKLDLDVRVHPRAGHIHEYTEAEFTKKMEMNVETVRIFNSGQTIFPPQKVTQNETQNPLPTNWSSGPAAHFK